MKDMKIYEFIEDLGSKSPAPGGGGASALSGALGVALTSMVYNLTIGKKSYEQLSEELKSKLNFNLERCKELKDTMLMFMDKDKEAFLALMDSYKLPKETDEEKKIRKSNIEMCTIKAMDIPFQLAKIAIEFYDNIKFAAKYGNKNLISDSAVAAIMLSACIESSIVNTE
ncbi:MAG: cyclodeaminase/cyclohydrolase family protein, partial [Sarcina sp.]